MSLGYCGKCRLSKEDDEYLTYEYSGENWNNKNSNSGDINLYDGCFLIKKTSLQNDDVWDAIENNDIILEKECKNAFLKYDDMEIDYIAYRLLIHIYDYYKKKKEFPKEESFIQ